MRFTPASPSPHGSFSSGYLRRCTHRAVQLVMVIRNRYASGACKVSLSVTCPAASVGRVEIIQNQVNFRGYGRKRDGPEFHRKYPTKLTLSLECLPR